MLDGFFGPGILDFLVRAGATGIGLSMISGIRGTAGGLVGGLGGNAFRGLFAGLSAPELVSNDFFLMRGGICRLLPAPGPFSRGDFRGGGASALSVTMAAAGSLTDEAICGDLPVGGASARSVAVAVPGSLVLDAVAASLDEFLGCSSSVRG